MANDMGVTANAQLATATHLIVQTLGAGISHRIEPDRKLIDDLGADSLDLIELQCAIEDLGADAPDSAFHRGMCVSDVAALIPEGSGS